MSSARPDPAATALLPVLRLLPAPDPEPPYDDEPPASRSALRLVPPPPTRSATPVRTVPAPTPVGPRPVEPTPTVADLDQPPGHRLRRTPTAQLPPPAPVARALVQRLLEVRAGLRPLPQLQAGTSPELYAQLERELQRRPRAVSVRPGDRQVRSVHVQPRPDGVAEVCATVRRGERMSALALRLEGAHGRWICTQLVGF